MKRTLLLAACLTNPLISIATETTAPDIINVCVNAEGHKILSNKACPSGYQTHAHKVEPNVLPSDGLRSWAKRSPAAPAQTWAQLAAERREALAHAERQERTIRCENAKRDYSFESTWKSHNARPHAKKIIMDRECAGL